MLSRRAFALVAVAVLASACTGGGLSTSSTTSTTRPTGPATNLGTLVASVTPPGWVPVDFGDGQVSVPVNWHVEYDVEELGDSVIGDCGLPSPPGALYVGMWAPLQPAPGAGQRQSTCCDDVAVGSCGTRDN